MICPACGKNNLPGADVCDKCLHDLSQYDAVHEELGEHILDDFVKDIPLRPPVAVPLHATVREVLDVFIEKNVHVVVVGDGSPYAGIFTERDFVYKVLGESIDRETTPISELMTHDPVALHAEDHLAKAMYALTLGGVRALPVVEDDRLIGIASLNCALDHLQKYAAAEREDTT